MMCDLYQKSSSWLLLSDELTPDFLRFVLYQTANVSVAYKDAPIDILREALRFVLRGERYIAQHAMSILLMKEIEDRHESTDLTQTEIEVLKAMTQGKTTKEIASERESSIHTINSHRKNIFRKLIGIYIYIILIILYIIRLKCYISIIFNFMIIHNHPIAPRSL